MNKNDYLAKNINSFATMNLKKANILDVARFIINYYRNNKDRSATNLELQKVLYYIQAYHLVRFDGHPFFDDVPEAWVRGPVYRTVYNRYREFGSDEIELEDQKSVKEDFEESINELDLPQEQLEFIVSALDYFSNMSYGQLITRTHAEKPWNEARNGLGPLDYSDETISHESMKKFYEELIERNKEKRKSS